jgi:hypothetical protein
MTNTVIKYKADDGTEFYRPEEAEGHNFFLKVRGVLRYHSGPKYSPGYDGPMPVYEPDLRTLCYYREKVRNLFLDLPEPEPVIIYKDVVKVEHRFPHWAAWWALILMGVFIGWAITWSMT